MNRRSFVTTLFGGLAAAGLAGTGLAHAATQAVQAAVPPLDAPPSQGLDEAAQAALDTTDAEFSQYVHRPHRPNRHSHYRRPQMVYRRPIKRRPPHHRRRSPYRRNVVR